MWKSKCQREWASVHVLTSGINSSSLLTVSTMCLEKCSLWGGMGETVFTVLHSFSSDARF